MSIFTKPKTCSFQVRRFWKPVIATGTGGTALVIWFEEIVVFAAEFLGIIFLPILAAILYFYNISLFKSYELRGEN